MNEVKTIVKPLSDFLEQYIAMTKEHNRDTQVSMFCTSVISITASHAAIHQECPYELSAALMNALEHYLGQQEKIKVM